MKLDLPISQFAQIINAEVSSMPSSGRIQQVAYDTRLITSGEELVFFALQGPQLSGLEFVSSAYEKGVRYFVVESLPSEPLNDAYYFKVQNSLEALQQLAAFHRKRLEYPVLALTGALGKTTIKEWIYHLLTPALRVYRSPKSYNSQLGVALSLLELPLVGDLGIIEAAITKPGEMERLARMICPDFCVLTSLFAPFRHEFASDEQYIDTLQILSQNSRWVIDPTTIESTDNSEFEALAKAIPFNDHIRRHNARMALRCALEFHQCSANAISQLPVLANRLEIIEGLHGAQLINDTYNLDLTAFRAALSFLKTSAIDKPKMVCCFIPQATPTLKSKLIQLCAENSIEQYYFWEEMPTDLPLLDHHYVLIKGDVTLSEQLLSKWRRKSHSTTVSYDFSALHHNIRQYQQILNPKTKILAMVKAQAYGAGLLHLAKQLVKSGVHYLGVAYADEGVLLREAGINVPILVLNAEEKGFDRCIAYELEPAIYSLTHLDSFIRALIANQKKAFPIHLKLDTGMHRLGFGPSEIQQIIEIISAQPEVVIKSIYSHLACADEPSNPMNALQLATFKNCTDQLQLALPYVVHRHILNSEGAAYFPEAQYDMVRLGIGLFGVHLDPEVESKLKPVMSWKSHISQLKHLKKGECIGYGCSDRLNEDAQIAIIPVGYADGFKRNLSNGKGGVYIDGEFCPTIGRVCMDMIMVVAPKANLQSEVEIIGPNQTLTNLSNQAQTIPYEILTSISPRVERTYIND